MRESSSLPLAELLHELNVTILFDQESEAVLNHNAKATQYYGYEGRGINCLTDVIDTCIFTQVSHREQLLENVRNLNINDHPVEFEGMKMPRTPTDSARASEWRVRFSPCMDPSTKKASIVVIEYPISSSKTTSALLKSSKEELHKARDLVVAVSQELHMPVRSALEMAEAIQDECTSKHLRQRAERMKLHLVQLQELLDQMKVTHSEDNSTDDRGSYQDLFSHASRDALQASLATLLDPASYLSDGALSPGPRTRRVYSCTGSEEGDPIITSPPACSVEDTSRPRTPDGEFRQRMQRVTRLASNGGDDAVLEDYIRIQQQFDPQLEPIPGSICDNQQEREQREREQREREQREREQREGGGDPDPSPPAPSGYRHRTPSPLHIPGGRSASPPSRRGAPGAGAAPARPTGAIAGASAPSTTQQPQEAQTRKLMEPPVNSAPRGEGAWLEIQEDSRERTEASSRERGHEEGHEKGHESKHMQSLETKANAAWQCCLISPSPSPPYSSSIEGTPLASRTNSPEGSEGGGQGVEMWSADGVRAEHHQRAQRHRTQDQASSSTQQHEQEQEQREQEPQKQQQQQQQAKQQAQQKQQPPPQAIEEASSLSNNLASHSLASRTPASANPLRRSPSAAAPLLPSSVHTDHSHPSCGRFDFLSVNSPDPEIDSALHRDLARLATIAAVNSHRRHTGHPSSASGSKSVSGSAHALKTHPASGPAHCHPSTPLANNHTSTLRDIASLSLSERTRSQPLLQGKSRLSHLAAQAGLSSDEAICQWIQLSAQTANQPTAIGRPPLRSQGTLASSAGSTVPLSSSEYGRFAASASAHRARPATGNLKGHRGPSHAPAAPARPAQDPLGAGADPAPSGSQAPAPAREGAGGSGSQGGAEAERGQELAAEAEELKDRLICHLLEHAGARSVELRRRTGWQERERATLEQEVTQLACLAHSLHVRISSSAGGPALASTFSNRSDLTRRFQQAPRV